MRLLEPVSLAIGLTALIEAGAGLIVGGAGAVTIFGLSAGAIGGAIVTAGVIAGAQYVAGKFLASSRPTDPSGGGAITGDTGGASSVNSPGDRYTERQSIPSKRVLVGRGYVGGAIFFEAAQHGSQIVAGSDPGSQGSDLYIGIMISEGPIDGIEGVWIGQNQLSIGVFPENAIIIPTSVPGQPAYQTFLQCSFRLGQDDQNMDIILRTDFTNLSKSFRQQGVATAVFRFGYGANTTQHQQLWGQAGRPQVYILARGIPVYDPRDPSQSINDESTWKWSNNASLIQAWYLTRPFGGRIPTNRIVWDKVAEAASYDDEIVSCKDGSFIKRYTIDGVITLNQRPVDVLTAMLTANRGLVLESAGRVWVSSSKPRTPIATIYDAILAGGIEYRAAKPKRDLLNEVTVRFIAEEQNFQTVDGPILSYSDLRVIDEEVLSASLDLPFTLDHRRAQRLQKCFLLNSRLGRTLTCKVDVAWYADLNDEPIGNAVNFESNLFSQANGIYRITSVAFADSFSSIELSLVEYDATIETDWNASVDEKDFILTNLTLS